MGPKIPSYPFECTNILSIGKTIFVKASSLNRSMYLGSKSGPYTWQSRRRNGLSVTNLLASRNDVV